ncbi:MAG: hypothetical protein A2Z18_03205 [Armatimonadetes bacterium RBG_16_58_9]|nr:MAG: hypothetical protein A2Z18_03205 [Armatimonadetes bacterium RBG_16_58_9]
MPGVDRQFISARRIPEPLGNPVCRVHLHVVQPPVQVFGPLNLDDQVIVLRHYHVSQYATAIFVAVELQITY